MLDVASQNTVAILVATTALLWLFGSVRLSHVGAVLFANWCAQSGYVVLVTSAWFVEGSANSWLSVLAGDYYPWLWWLAIDAATAWYMFKPSVSYTQIFIGAIGIAQVLFHGAFALNPLIADMYLNSLDWLGRAQLAALIAGGGYGVAWSLYCRVPRSRDGIGAVASAADRIQGGA